MRTSVQSWKDVAQVHVTEPACNGREIARIHMRPGPLPDSGDFVVLQSVPQWRLGKNLRPESRRDQAKARLFGWIMAETRGVRNIFMKVAAKCVLVETYGFDAPVRPSRFRFAVLRLYSWQTATNLPEVRARGARRSPDPSKLPAKCGVERTY
ncbi:hypothetical protein [Paraburkholderia guartelaensis]|uniref:hypothetical protein n=1 Tax=Paraburkholderia guartelaensis TaxID=2546446 RepID=UPI002AB5E99C|nr:hypothetical protein [Paraburkholderia guartelaensis]